MSHIGFAMIGSQKCGTETTRIAFRGHPQVFMDNVELFRDEIPEGNLQRFRDDLIAKAAGKPIVGPMSPQFAFKGAGLPMKACFGPDLKLLITVRDPVKRAISNYWMEMGRNYGEELKAHLKKMPMVTVLTDTNHSFLKRGHYHHDLVRFLEHFPREQLLITRLEDMAVNMSAVLNAMVCWIGADPFLAEQVHTRQHVGHYGSDAPAEVISFLAEHYAVSNRLLHEEFGVRIDDWTS